MKHFKHNPIVYIGFIFLSLVMIFALSSKAPDPNDYIPSYCESYSHSEDEIVNIHLDFEDNGGYNNIPYRSPGYDSYHPYKDLRNGYPNPESSLANYNDSYYCVLEVGTPDCIDWSWQTLIPSGGSKTFTIHLPKAEYGWDVVVNIKYYERCSIGSYAESFNTTVQYGIWTNTATPYLYSGPITYFYMGPQQLVDCDSFSGQDGEVSIILQEWFE